MQNLLADTNWLIRLERELRAGTEGPAVKLCRRACVHVNPISHAEFLARGDSDARRRALARLHFARNLDFQDSTRAAALRQQRAKQGKALSTPDAFMAATAIRYRMRLVTADKDFSGIPGLRWSAYRR